MTDTDARMDALAPLLSALVGQAQAEAEGIRSTAEEDGRRVLAAARAEAAALIAEARARGLDDARALLAVERARGRRAARNLVLDAQRASFDELSRQARTAVRDLLEDPTARDRLATLLRRRLGDGAIIRDHPEGGLVAEGPDGRTIDASVPALVERAVADLDLEQLWKAS